MIRPASTSSSPPEREAPRGFVLLLVMTGLLIVSAAVAVQLRSASSQKLLQARQEQSLVARGMAEGCLNRAWGVAIAHLEVAPDFDALINPDGVAASGDELIPADLTTGYGAGEVVYVPRGEATAADPRKSLHRYLLTRANGGGCLVRFDDNFDEVGAQDYLNDQDGRLTVTAIGLFPVSPTTAADDAYDRAHARVTLNRVMGVANVAPRGLVSGDDVSFGNQVSVCGATAGMSVGEDGSFTASACVCGDVTSAPLPSALSGCCSGDCPSSGAAAAGVGRPPPAPSLAVPPPFNEATALGGAGPASNGVCELWVRDGDAINPSTGVQYLAGGDYFDGTGADAFVYIFDSADPACTDADTTYSSGGHTLVKRPCKWTASGPTCAAEETACWFPLGKLGTCGAACADIFFLGPRPLGTYAAGMGITDPGVVTNTTAVGDLCGCGAGECLGAVGAELFKRNAATTDVTVELSPPSSNDAPPKSIVLWELETSPPPHTALTTNVAYINTTAPLQMTHLVQGKLFVEDGADLCCAGCDCTTACPSSTHRGKELIRASEACYLDDGITSRGDVACASVQIDNAASCAVGDISGFGDTEGYSGAAAGIFQPGDAADTCNFTVDGSDCGWLGVCLGTGTSVKGAVRAAGDICLAAGTGNATRDVVTGLVHAGNDVVVMRYNNVDGQLIAGDDVAIEQDARVRFDMTHADYAADVVHNASAGAAWLEASW